MTIRRWLRAAAATALLGASSLTACSTPGSQAAAPLVYGPNEVPLDQSFTLFLDQIPDIRGSLLFFVSIRSGPDSRLVCSAFFDSNALGLSFEINHVVLSGDNGSFAFNGSNSIFQPMLRGELIDFKNPNHKAKCITMPPEFPVPTHHTVLLVYPSNNLPSMQVKVGPEIKPGTIATMRAG